MAQIDDILTVWIGSVPYSIVYKSPIIVEEQSKILWGHIRQSHQLIEIEQSLPPEMKRIVLMHEIIHGMLTHAGLIEHSEDVPERLSYQLDNLFTQNPDLLKLWTSNNGLKQETYTAD